MAITVSRQNCKQVYQTTLRNTFWFSHSRESCIRKRKNNSTLELKLDIESWGWAFFLKLEIDSQETDGFCITWNPQDTLYKKKKPNPQYILTIQPESQLRGQSATCENTSMGEKVMTHLFTVACKHTVKGVGVLDSAPLSSTLTFALCGISLEAICSRDCYPASATAECSQRCGVIEFAGLPLLWLQTWLCGIMATAEWKTSWNISTGTNLTVEPMRKDDKDVSKSSKMTLMCME